MNLTWTAGVFFGVTLIAYAQPAWIEPPEAWTKATARQVLSSSPWAKTVRSKVSASYGKAAPEFTIRWESALPVARAHAILGSDQPLLGGRGYYAIAVIGPLEEVSTSLVESNLKKVTGKAAVAAVECRAIRQRDGAAVLLFLFPATLDIGEPRRFHLPFGHTSNSGQLEFSVNFGALRLKQTFPLKDMIYRGRLEL
jgi:hypothetical protein